MSNLTATQSRVSTIQRLPYFPAHRAKRPQLPLRFLLALSHPLYRKPRIPPYPLRTYHSHRRRLRSNLLRKSHRRLPLLLLQLSQHHLLHLKGLGGSEDFSFTCSPSAHSHMPAACGFRSDRTTFTTFSPSTFRLVRMQSSILRKGSFAADSRMQRSLQTARWRET